jgi:hypothetical protein
MNGSSPTFPARLSSWPFAISRNARPTNAFADIFGPRAVLVAGVSTNGGRTSTTLMPTPANADAAQWRRSEAPPCSPIRSARAWPEAAKPGADHDDQGIATRAQQWQQSPGQENGARQIDRDFIDNPSVAHLFVQQVDVLHDPGVVNQDIEPAMAILDRRRQGQHLLRNRDVASDSLDGGVLILEIPERGLVASTRDHWAPSVARRSTNARPIPELPPVTATTRSRQSRRSEYVETIDRHPAHTVRESPSTRKAIEADDGGP